MEMVRSGEAGSGVNADILVALSNILLAEGQPSVGYGIAAWLTGTPYGV